MRQSPLDFTAVQPFDPSSMAIAPSPHREAKETSALAAIENTATSRRGKQNARILSLLRAAGSIGMADIELHRATGFPRASICARRGFDLKSLIEPAGRYVDPKTKRSHCRWRLRNGND